MADPLSPVLARLDRIKRRERIASDAALSIAIAGPKHNKLVARLRKRSGTIKTLCEVAEWCEAREASR